MAESATSEPTNKVEITDAGPSLKRLSIEVPAETVAERMAESMDTLIVEATLPGFRKGRVPRKLLERKFGSSMREEAKKQLVASAYSDAVERNGLKVIGEPSSELLEDVTIEEGQPLKFEIEVEVLPEFELPGWDGLKIDKPMFEVTDETIDEEIKKISINDGELEQQTTAGKDDYITGHGIMTDADGDKAFLSWKCEGPAGKGCSGTFDWTAGTGKYTGIQGKNTFQSTNVTGSEGHVAWQGEYRLP